MSAHTADSSCKIMKFLRERNLSFLKEMSTNRLDLNQKKRTQKKKKKKNVIQVSLTKKIIRNYMYYLLAFVNYITSSKNIALFIVYQMSFGT